MQPSGQSAASQPSQLGGVGGVGANPPQREDEARVAATTLNPDAEMAVLRAALVAAESRAVGHRRLPDTGRPGVAGTAELGQWASDVGSHSTTAGSSVAAMLAPTRAHEARR